MQTERCHRLHQAWQEQQAALIISFQITAGTLPGASQLVEQRAVHPSSLTHVSVQRRGSAVSSQLLLWYPGSRPGLKVFVGSRQAPNYPESYLVHLYSGATLKFLGDSNEIPRHSYGSGNMVTGTRSQQPGCRVPSLCLLSSCT